jgi:hypothetical protein
MNNHPRDKHYFICNHCGYSGKETELEESTHPCGKDKCPECGEEGFISCCKSEPAAHII